MAELELHLTQFGTVCVCLGGGDGGGRVIRENFTGKKN